MRTDPSRYDRVLEHPEYGRAPPQPVLPAEVIGVAALVQPLSLSLFGIVFLLIALSLVGELDAPLAFAVLAIGGALALVFSGIATTARLAAFRKAPIERFVAVVIKERTEDDDGTTACFTTLQTRDGQRAEYYTYRPLVGRVAVDDIGVAYVKARTLVEFLRYEVD